MTKYLKNTAGAPDQVSSGNLRTNIAARSEKVLLGGSCAGMVENLSEGVGAASAPEISTSTTQLAANATKTATTVEEVKQAAQFASQKAKAVSDSAQRAPKHGLNARKVLLPSFGFAVLLLGVVGWFGDRHTLRMQETATWVAHTYRLDAAIAKMQMLLDEMQGAQDEYVLSGRSDQRDLFQDATVEVVRQIALLRGLVVNSEMAASFSRVAPALEARLELARRVVKLRQDGAIAGAQAELTGATVRQLDGKIRREFVEMEKLQALLLQQRTARALREARTVRQIRLGGTATSIALLGAIFLMLHRENQLRIQSETQLRENMKNLAQVVRANELIMEHSLDVICTIDGEGRFAFVSAACERMWGYAPAELVGRRYIDFVHAEDHPVTNEAAAAIMGGRPVRDFENRYCRKDGSVVSTVWAASWSAADQLMFCVAHDVTERKRSQETLRRAHDELRLANVELGQASKHKDDFLANMSHELRTPLNSILGLSESLLEQIAGPLAPRQLKSVTTIARSGQHLLALINDILDLSKIEAGKLDLNPEPLELDEFCRSCLAFVRTQAMEKKIAVAYEPDVKAAHFSADAKRLKQILVNLLTNAVKFTGEGGRIGLTVTAPDDEEVLRFTVWDTGVGIAPADQAKLFRAFTQIDSGLTRSQEGTGLGLALVAKLTELHGGSVQLESEPGQGSRFTVTIPRVASSRRAPQALVEHEPDRRGYSRALIIEDDPTSASILDRYLGDVGLESVVHARGAKAVDAVLREKPDLILLDIQLPDDSGWVVLTRLKEHPGTRDIPVAVVSVVDEPQKARALGAVAHFTKPVTREQLAGFLQRGAVSQPPGAVGVAVAAQTGPGILLAEDNEANIETIGGYLGAKGYAMSFAANGRLAVNLARQLRPALILMDIQMPVMDGLSAIRELRTDLGFKDTPIIALTALAMPGDRERCLAAGATDYMSKPISLKALASLVARLVAATPPKVAASPTLPPAPIGVPTQLRA